MTLLRCALLCLLACGSPRTQTGTPPIESPRSDSAVQPLQAATAKPVAVAIVFEGWEMWVGNDHIPDISDHERYVGVLRPLQAAFARLQVTDFPVGSQAAVVTYTEGATTRHPMQPIEKLSAAAFGEQKDYLGVIDRDLVGGVKLGLDELAKVKDRRRILVVIGDGSDTTPDKAKLALAELAKRAAADNVEVVSFVYQGILSPPTLSIRAFDASPVVVNTVEGIADQLSWLFTRLKQPPVVAASGAGKGLVLALLVEGAEVWMGNDDFVPANDPSRYLGALKAIRAAFEQAPMTGFPAGSKALLVTYDSKSQLRVPAMPIESFDARTVGVQRDYYGFVGTELVGGVTTAFGELLKVDGARRVLVILGDGADTNNEAAKEQLRSLAKRAAEYHIEVHAIVYKGPLSVEDTVVTVLDPKARTVASTDGITTALVEVFTRLRKQ